MKNLPPSRFQTIAARPYMEVLVSICGRQRAKNNQKQLNTAHGGIYKCNQSCSLTSPWNSREKRVWYGRYGLTSRFRLCSTPANMKHPPSQPLCSSRCGLCLQSLSIEARQCAGRSRAVEFSTCNNALELNQTLCH